MLLQFLRGYYRADTLYEDRLEAVFLNNVSSVTGFWFDCVTSIPWTYLDLDAYLVGRPDARARGLLSHCPVDGAGCPVKSGHCPRDSAHVEPMRQTQLLAMTDRRAEQSTRACGFRSFPALLFWVFLRSACGL